MTYQETLDELKFHVTRILSEEGRDLSHDASHILRVHENCMKIGKEEKANMKVLGAASLFHDIVRPSGEKGEVDHALKSAIYARGVLRGYGYSEKEIEMVEEAIVTSSRSGGTGEIPKTLEAKILYDADKIDGGGEIGIKRTQALWKRRSEEKGEQYDEKTAMRWYLGRITDVLNIGLFTDYGKKMMDEDLRVSLSYIKKTIGGELEETVKRDLGEKSSKYLALVK